MTHHPRQIVHVLGPGLVTGAADDDPSGIGVLAVPNFTGSAAYAVAAAFDWRAGLEEGPRTAPGCSLVTAAALLAGLAGEFIGIAPMTALSWAAVLNGVLAPPLLIVILILLAANHPAVMGEQRHGWRLNLLGGAAAVLMSAAAIGLLLT